ncbi:hypothetical protein RUND412_005967 [Rhizina undulata]
MAKPQNSKPKQPPSQSQQSSSSTSGQAPTQAASPVAPRIDVEPMYDALKAALGKADWGIYKESLSGYLTGRLNQEELSERIGGFIKGPAIRLHNQLLFALYGNAMRDNPPTDVAAWVSASDKPGAPSKMPAGDLNERQLKKEIMGISARERRRIKEVPEIDINLEDPLGNIFQEYHLAKQIRIPEPPPPMSAGLNKTNWESEIKQRYTLPLAAESGEFPDVESIRLRMLPICYEESIPGGCTPDAANFMNVAAETFVKEILSCIISRVRSNGPDYVQTAKYKKLSAKGKWVSPERPLLGMQDVRLSLTLGDNFLAQLPGSMKKIMAGAWYERDFVAERIEEDPVVGWEGGSGEDRMQLRGLLDDCLATAG